MSPSGSLCRAEPTVTDPLRRDRADVIIRWLLGGSRWMQAGQDYFVIDNVVSFDELLWIYHELIATPGWSLMRSSTGQVMPLIPFMSFPGLDIESNGVIEHEFLAGYFRSLVFRVRSHVRLGYGRELPPEIQRIHVGAKSSLSRTERHADSKDPSWWTILCFMNPVWNAQDGGEFKLEDDIIEYRAGRTVVFPSCKEHDGGFVRNEALNYWRVGVNIILSP